MRWRELLQEAARELAAAGIEQARFEARLLATSAAGIALERLLMDRDRDVPNDIERAVRVAIARRATHEPAAHILGWREFWGLRFAVSAEVLTPRPDSETLVEAVLEAIPDRHRSWRLLDLGTGSGCLAIALLSELPQARALAVDISPAALAIAARNAADLGVADRLELRLGDWTSGLARRFDIVVSNPPYIASHELRGLAPEVVDYEPRLALDGGPDGLQAYRRLAVELPTVLGRSGIAALEVGFGQASEVCQLIENKGFVDIDTHRDLAGIERVVTARARK